MIGTTGGAGKGASPLRFAAAVLGGGSGRENAKRRVFSFRARIGLVVDGCRRRRLGSSGEMHRWCGSSSWSERRRRCKAEGAFSLYTGIRARKKKRVQGHDSGGPGGASPATFQTRQKVLRGGCPNGGWHES